MMHFASFIFNIHFLRKRLKERTEPFFSKKIPNLVQGDLKQPAFEAIRRLQGPQVIESLQKNLLGDILGIHLGLYAVKDHPKYAFVKGIHETVKGSFIAAARLEDPL